MKLVTIGVTKKSAEYFFKVLSDSQVRQVVDVRINNTGQLAGFTKKPDFEYFLRTLCNVDYRHAVELAPTRDLLKAYKQRRCTWKEYERRFRRLIEERQIERIFTPSELDNTCLLCSEPGPEQCHRRLVAEYLSVHWVDVQIEHLT